MYLLYQEPRCVVTSALAHVCSSVMMCVTRVVSHADKAESMVNTPDNVSVAGTVDTHRSSLSQGKRHRHVVMKKSDALKIRERRASRQSSVLSSFASTPQIPGTPLSIARSEISERERRERQRHARAVPPSVPEHESVEEALQFADDRPSARLDQDLTLPAPDSRRRRL